MSAEAAEIPASSAEPVIRFRNVRKSFVRDDSEFDALQGLSFDVRRGEYVCVVGRTGSGKSTALNLLLGLLEPTAGSVSVLGLDPYRQFLQLKGRLACIFQGDRLLPWRTVLENVKLPLQILGTKRAREGLCLEWLERVGLRDVARRYPHELSGGMRQRVALARAMVCQPEILLADEAFAHLDAVTGARIKSELRALTRAAGITVVHITHAIDEAIDLADRIFVLGNSGRITASFDEVPDQPRSTLYTAIYSQVAASDAGKPPAAGLSR